MEVVGGSIPLATTSSFRLTDQEFDAPPMPVITLPDGSQKTFDRPVTVDEVAASIGAGLRKAALAGRIDGKVVDTSHVIDRDVSLSIVTDKDPDGLDVIRHSTAHL